MIHVFFLKSNFMGFLLKSNVHPLSCSALDKNNVIKILYVFLSVY